MEEEREIKNKNNCKKKNLLIYFQISFKKLFYKIIK